MELNREKVKAAMPLRSTMTKKSFATTVPPKFSTDLLTRVLSGALTAIPAVVPYLVAEGYWSHSIRWGS
jgi:hypothetical protein